MLLLEDQGDRFVKMKDFLNFALNCDMMILCRLWASSELLRLVFENARLNWNLSFLLLLLYPLLLDLLLLLLIKFVKIFLFLFLKYSYLIFTLFYPKNLFSLLSNLSHQFLLYYQFYLQPIFLCIFFLLITHLWIIKMVINYESQVDYREGYNL